MKKEPTPDAILELTLAFWGSKTLLSAVELGLFTELAKGPKDKDVLRVSMGINERSVEDFLDALVALGMLDRKAGKYRNTPETDLFLDRNKPTYIGGVLEMANERLFGFWNSLTEGLRTGVPQNEAKQGGNLFEAIYGDPQKLRGFLQAMTGLSLGSGRRYGGDVPMEEVPHVHRRGRGSRRRAGADCAQAPAPDGREL